MSIWSKLGFGEKKPDRMAGNPAIPSGEEKKDPRDIFEQMLFAARTLKQEGKYPEAEFLYKSMVDVARALGDNNPIYAVSVSNLALLYQETGRPAEAEPLHRQSLALFLKTPLGKYNPTYATVLQRLAELYEQAGQTAQAEQCHQQVLELRRPASH
jgi:tetratricopeptide (TPR) repeat protein